mmetsp:Transcript_13357/g.26400  ORF Transcript_13357/g.26400 Transcript_13357/m.26400 type:complete len:114 (-) Transcript_13357:205-546(-)
MRREWRECGSLETVCSLSSCIRIKNMNDYFIDFLTYCQKKRHAVTSKISCLAFFREFFYSFSVSFLQLLTDVFVRDCVTMPACFHLCVLALTISRLSLTSISFLDERHHESIN